MVGGGGPEPFLKGTYRRHFAPAERSGGATPLPSHLASGFQKSGGAKTMKLISLYQKFEILQIILTRNF
jgi:hypothetical protein